MYSTAADVLASLLLDLNKVSVESSIFTIEFENVTARYFWMVSNGNTIVFLISNIL